MTTVNINSNVVTPTSQQEGGHQYAESASDSNYILVQFDSHLEEDQVEELQHKYHVQVVDFVATNTYICRYEPAELDKIRSIPYVRYANVYHPDLVCSPALRTLAGDVRTQSRENAAQAGRAAPHSPSLREHVVNSVRKLVGSHTVEVPVPNEFIIFVHDRDRLESVRQEISQVPGVDASSIVQEGKTALRAKFDIGVLAAVSRIDDVKHVEQIHPYQPHNFKAREALGFSNQFPSNFNPGRGTKMVNDYKGETQVVVVADSGFDIGSATDVHPAFTKRVKRVVAANTRNATLDDSGHGTHVAGSVLGHGNSVQFPGYIDGSAPGAHLILQACAEDDGNFNTRHNGSLSNLFVMSGMLANAIGKGNDHPPRVHSNSWGTSWTSDQTVPQAYGDAQFIDEVVRDAQDWVLVFSAGNDGQKAPAPTIQTTSSAKNSIVVGACENAQPMFKETISFLDIGWRWRLPTFKNWTNYAYDKNRPPGTPEQVADFSSRGPTVDGRLKPDVVAPGAVIYSARSRTPNLDIASAPWYIGPIPIPKLRKYDYNRIGISTDDHWWFMNGTSMACPHVAGCCAVLRKAYGDVKGQWPSAAMVKALLVNGAVDLSIKGTDPARHGGPAPNGVQGFGRVDIARSLLPIVNKSGFVYDSLEFPADYAAPPTSMWVAGAAQARFLKQNQQRIFTVDNPKIGSILTVTLAYTDLPGAALVNLVTLGARRASVNVNEQWAMPDPRNPATENNVQRLIWRLDEKVKYSIVVRCERVKTVAPLRADERVQDYALCYYLAPPPK